MAQDLQMVVLDRIFDEKEVGRFRNVKNIKPHSVEIGCGCTLRRYGDISGTLQIFDDGKLLVECECSDPRCNRVITPAEFAKHGGKPSPALNWRSQIWVANKNGKRVKLSKTCLLKYHTEPFKRVQRGHTVHRDEFMICTCCGKMRRFSQRTAQDCRAYHDALAKVDWTCFDMEKPCDDEEERMSRIPSRGCPNKTRCNGCVRCVCVGCSMCRFEDCSCQTCVDFCQNKLNS